MTKTPRQQIEEILEKVVNCYDGDSHAEGESLSIDEAIPFLLQVMKGVVGEEIPKDNLGIDAYRMLNYDPHDQEIFAEGENYRRSEILRKLEL